MAFQSNDHHAVGLALNLKAECHKESQKSQHDSRSSQPREKMCAKMEQQYVHDVYNKTAHHFTDVKYKAWPKVKQFLLNLAPGSIVADVGESEYLKMMNSSCVTFLQLFLSFFLTLCILFYHNS